MFFCVNKQELHNTVPIHSSTTTNKLTLSHNANSYYNFIYWFCYGVYICTPNPVNLKVNCIELHLDEMTLAFY